MKNFVKGWNKEDKPSENIKIYSLKQFLFYLPSLCWGLSLGTPQWKGPSNADTGSGTRDKYSCRLKSST